MKDTDPSHTDRPVEDFTGKDRLVSNVVTSWVAQLLIIIVGFFLPRAIDQQLGQVSMGIWDFAWSIISYVNLAHLGIGSALNRYVAKYRVEGQPEKLRVAISTTIAIQWLIATAVALVSVSLYFLIPVLFSDRLEGQEQVARGVVLFLGLSVAALLLFDTSRGVLTGCHRWDLFNAINSLTQIASTIAMISVIMMGGSLVDVSITYLLMMVLQGVLRSIAARRVCAEFAFSAGRIEWKFAKEIFLYGMRSILVNIPGLLALQATYIAVVSVLGPASLAILARPLALVRYIDTFITRFTYVLTPMAESVLQIEGKEKLSEFATKSSVYGFAFAIPPVMLLGIFGDEVIRLWMGADYVNRWVIWVISGMGLLTSFHSPILRIVIGLDLHGEAALRAMLITATVFGGGLFVGHLFDLYSLEFFAVLTSVCSIALSTLYIPYYACSKLGISYRGFLGDLFCPPVQAALALGAVTFAIDLLADPNLMGSVALGLGYLTIIGIYYYFSLVPPEIKSRFLARQSS